VDENEKVADSVFGTKVRQSEVNTMPFVPEVLSRVAVSGTVCVRLPLTAVPVSRFVPPDVIENENGKRVSVVPSKLTPVPVMVRSAGTGTPMAAQVLATRKVNSTGNGDGVVPKANVSLSKKYGSPVPVGFTTPKRTAWLAIGCNENSAAAASPIRNFFISSPF
jgi:hypothetical protein